MAVKKKKRTPLQQTADAFDCSLFKLMYQAEALATKGSGMQTNQGERDDWKEIAYALKRARPYVRKMMHKDDLAGTE